MMKYGASTKHALAALATACLVALATAPALASGEHEGGHGDAGQSKQQERKKDDGHGHDNGHGHDDGHGHKGDHDMAFGSPASADEADRTVEIVAHDTMRFEPSEVEVEAGETVRFVVRNAGELQHSFTLGTPAQQKAHDREMKDMSREAMAGHMKGDPTGMVIPPGETGSLTWRFSGSGPVQFACHIPGHYPAGMKGRIRMR